MLAVDIHKPLTEDERGAIVDAVACRIVARRLETPTIMFLEIHKPLSFLASQATLVAMPLLAPLIGAQHTADLSKLLADRRGIDLLIDRIEEMAAERGNPPPSRPTPERVI
jgi:hypothetical protein